MRLFYFSDNVFPKNKANQIQTISMINAFIKNNINCTLYQTGEINNFKIKYPNYNFKIKKISTIINKNFFKKLFLIFSTFIELRSLITNKKINNDDIIYSRATYCGLGILGAKLIYKNKFPMIITESHRYFKEKEPFIKLIKSYLIKTNLKYSDLIITITQKHKKNYLNLLNLNNNKINVLHDGVEIEKFNKINNSQKKIKKKLGISTNKRIIMYVGDLRKEKGINTIISTAKSFKSNLKLLFYIIGGTISEIDKIKKKLKKEKINNIKLLGYIKHETIPFYLKSADILIMPLSKKSDPSWGSPLKLFEYMASKRPILCSKIPSICEVVSDNEVTFFKSDNSNEFYKQILYILKNYSKSNNKAINAFKKVKKYTWDHRVKHILYQVKLIYNSK
jgi:glycosyltransferase involved in cell wall biosynthesis